MAQPKAARAADVVAPAMPEPDIAAELDALAARSSSSPTRGTAGAAEGRPPLVVVGHRGKGMNALASPDPRTRGDVRENTLRSFNDAAAAGHPAVAYVEFDVQVRDRESTAPIPFPPASRSPRPSTSAVDHAFFF
jgi:glycerophosphodiester phosphodiesterase